MLKMPEFPEGMPERWQVQMERVELHPGSKVPMDICGSGFCLPLFREEFRDLCAYAIAGWFKLAYPAEEDFARLSSHECLSRAWEWSRFERAVLQEVEATGKESLQAGGDDDGTE